MDLANLAINATPPGIPFAEDEYLFADTDLKLPSSHGNNTPITPVRIHQPVLQANVKPQQQPPPYGYIFPPATPHPIAQAFGPYYSLPTTPNQFQQSPHHPGYFQVPQHSQHGQLEVVPPTRTATPPPSPLPNISKRNLSLSPQKPKKRTRGGGPGSRGGHRGRGGQGATRGSANVKNSDPVKETEDQSVFSVEIIEDDEVFANTRWTDDERTTLFEYYLGPESDEVFDKLKNNAIYAHKKASKVLFGRKYSQEAIRGQYTRAYDTFAYILALEGFTGGGGDGDEDSNDDEDPTEKKITLARSRGIALGALTSKTYHKWQSHGWYDLFANRMGKSSKVTRSVVRNSCAPLSDAEPTVGNSESSDNEESSRSGSKAGSPISKPQSSKLKSSKHAKASKSLKLKAGSRKVSEPKHVGAKGFKEESRGSVSALDRLVELKANIEEMKIKRMGSQQAAEAAQRKFEIAKQVMEMDNVSDEVKAKANELLLQLMS
ncbi:hypothetical protein M378DRAFT_17904 [Amanita muscaria Koide BX008]|uniref:Uncharacterized protein n=1 Tax=Amanita muscaria (strain Koide BX008) TaxID=946122 RepID=A0A0C2WHD4_AMAMK|nr:hypothetical protein M378DRAFT_17904 [Amanita muscaria Koide BX008]